MLSETSQTQRQKYHMSSFICGNQDISFTEEWTGIAWSPEPERGVRRKDWSALRDAENNVGIVPGPSLAQ